jgi:hypothetical protein
VPRRFNPGEIVHVSVSGTRDRKKASFRISRAENNVVSAVHLDGAPLKEFFVDDRLLVVVEVEGRNVVCEAVVTGCHLPDILVFRISAELPERSGREYARIDDFLCLECTVIKGDEQSVIEGFRRRAPRKSHMQLASSAGFTKKDDRNVIVEVEKEILKVLVAMDQKIDAVMKFLGDGNRGVLMSFTPRRVNLSGSGMRLSMTGPVSAGDFLDIRLFLPDSCGVPVSILGAVIRSEQTSTGGSPGVDVAVNFHYIEEEDRDRLVRYIFSRQREAIRSNAERKGGERNVV